MINFEFTFKTNSEYLSKRVTGFIPEYKIVRMVVGRLGGGKMDFPVHSEEEYGDLLRRHKQDIIDIYPTTTFYEWDEY
jgi:hypothetical protein